MRLNLLALLLLWSASAGAVFHDPQWIYRYDGPGENTDDARRVELGADGNLYVAGWCTDSPESGDFLVISLVISVTHAIASSPVGLTDEDFGG